MAKLRMGIALASEDDTHHAEVSMWREDGAEIAQIIDAFELDEAIDAFAVIRGAMEPRFEGDHFPNPKRTLMTHDRFAFVPSEPGKDRVLAFLHPAFGWLEFGLSDDQALDLARGLQRDVPARR